MFEATNINQQLSDEGSPCTLQGTVFYVRSVKYRPYQRELNKRLRKLQREHKTRDMIPTEMIQSVNRELVPKLLLTGWDGQIRDSDGTLLNYSQEAAMRVFCKESSDDYVSVLYEHASSRANYEDEEVEELAGKLEIVSSN